MSRVVTKYLTQILFSSFPLSSGIRKTAHHIIYSVTGSPLIGKYRISRTSTVTTRRRVVSVTLIISASTEN